MAASVLRGKPSVADIAILEEVLRKIREEPQQPLGREEHAGRARDVAEIDLGDEAERTTCFRADRPLEILREARQSADVTTRLLVEPHRPADEEHPFPRRADGLLACACETRVKVRKNVAHGRSGRVYTDAVTFTTIPPSPRHPPPRSRSPPPSPRPCSDPASCPRSCSGRRVRRRGVSAPCGSR